MCALWIFGAMESVAYGVQEEEQGAGEGAWPSAAIMAVEKAAWVIGGWERGLKDTQMFPNNPL